MSKCPICYTELNAGVSGWTDDPIKTPHHFVSSLRGETLSRAPHIIELRERINAYETAVGITPLTEWTALTAKQFVLRPQYINELREAIEGILAVLGISLADWLSYDENGDPTLGITDWLDGHRLSKNTIVRGMHIEQMRKGIEVIQLYIYNPTALTVDIGRESGLWTLTFSGSCQVSGNPDTAIITLNANPYPSVISPTIIKNDPRDFKIKLTILDGGQPFNRTVFIEECNFKFLISRGATEYSRIYNFGKFSFGFEYSIVHISFPGNIHFYDGTFTLQKAYTVGSFETFNRIKSINSTYFNASDILGIDWSYFRLWIKYYDNGYLYEWYDPDWGWFSHWMFDDYSCLDNAGFWLRKRYTTMNVPNNPPSTFSVILVVDANYFYPTYQYDFTLTINYSV